MKLSGLKIWKIIYSEYNENSEIAKNIKDGNGNTMKKVDT